MNLKSITVSLFSVMSNDIELLDMMGIQDMTMDTIKDYIVEDKYPNDLADDNSSRICIYENPSTRVGDIETGWVQVDIYVPKRINKRDRRILLLAEKVIKMLDHKKRVKRGLEPIEAGIELSYYNRLPNMAINSHDWVKYGVVFKYKYIRV